MDSKTKEAVIHATMIGFYVGAGGGDRGDALSLSVSALEVGEKEEKEEKDDEQQEGEDE